MTDIFISDIHLSEEDNDLYGAFSRFIRQLDDSVERLYILGDLLEACIGDDKSKLSKKLAAEFQLLAKRKIRVFFQAGNRDFLVGKRFAQMADIEILPDYYLYKGAEQQILLMHGDLLCTDDTSYLRYRRVVHNPVIKRIFRLLPLFIRQKIGQKVRNKSTKGKSKKRAEIMDVNQSAVVKTMEKYKVTCLIHGHTHRPAVHSFKNQESSYTRYVLGDWYDKLWWIKSDENGISLHSEKI